MSRIFRVVTLIILLTPLLSTTIAVAAIEVEKVERDPVCADGEINSGTIVNGNQVTDVWNICLCGQWQTTAEATRGKFCGKAEYSDVIVWEFNGECPPQLIKQEHTMRRETKIKYASCDTGNYSQTPYYMNQCLVTVRFTREERDFTLHPSHTLYGDWRTSYSYNLWYELEHCNYSREYVESYKKKESFCSQLHPEEDMICADSAAKLNLKLQNPVN